LCLRALKAGSEMIPEVQELEPIVDSYR
jgi:hypothetical protein